MIAGALCEETDCTFLTLLFLAAFAGIALVATLMAAGAFMYVNAVLRDRHVARVPRSIIASVIGAGAVTVFWSLVRVTLVGPHLAFLAAVLVFAAGIVRQSKPCSRA